MSGHWPVAMQHALCGLFIYRLSGHRKGDEHPIYVLSGAQPTLHC